MAKFSPSEIIFVEIVPWQTYPPPLYEGPRGGRRWGARDHTPWSLVPSPPHMSSPPPLSIGVGGRHWLVPEEKKSVSVILHRTAQLSDLVVRPHVHLLCSDPLHSSDL